MSTIKPPFLISLRAQPPPHHRDLSFFPSKKNGNRKGAWASSEDGRSGIWREVFGELYFPIVWPLYISLQAFPGKRFLQGDSQALTSVQEARLSELMAAKFKVPRDEVITNLRAGPIPILDENVSVSFCLRHSRMLA